MALWVSDGQLQELGGWASGLNSIGRLTGLVSADLLLIQVLLMARLPLVERTYGQDELARRHRLVGFTSLNLMLVHVLLITLGYASQDGKNPFVELWDLVVDYPGMLLAAVGDGAAGHGGRHQRQARPAGSCATSPGTCCTCTPTSASASRCRTSCGPARTS